MKKVIQIIVAAVVIANLTGCATPYMIDRKRDLADIFTVAVGEGAGVKVQVGPIAAPGLIWSFNRAGLVGGDPFVDSDASCDHGADFATCPILAVFDTGNMSDVAVQRNKFYQATYCLCFPVFKDVEGNDARYPAPYFTQLEITAGLWYTLKLGVNPGELLDFLLGWTMVDIYHDDIGNAPIRSAKQNLRDEWRDGGRIDESKKKGHRSHPPAFPD